MMSLRTMLRVDSLIDDAGRNPIADAIVGRWRHDPGSTRFFRSSANFVYRFASGPSSYFLRFSADSERSRGAMVAEAELMSGLAEGGAPVPTAVWSLSGEMVETVQTPTGVFHAAVFPEVRGESFEIGEIDRARTQEWGAALAGLHGHLEAVSPTRAEVWPDWRSQLVAAREAAADPVLEREADDLLALLEAIDPGPGHQGLIHGDFQLDNLVWRDDGAGILDFGSACRHWWATDIAFALADAAIDGQSLPGQPAALGFLEGYHQHRSLDEGVLTHLDTFLRCHRFGQAAVIARALDLDADEPTPAWMTRLADRLRQHITDYRASIERA